MGNRKAGRSKFIEYRIWAVLLLVIAVMTANIWVMQARAQSKAYDITGKELNDIQNYKKGWYKSWGGEFEESGGSLSSIIWYRVAQPSYYIVANDSRIQIAISEYDKDGKWIKYSDKYQNGSKFTRQTNTEYVHLTLSSSVWGTDIQSLFQNGLQIEFSTEQREAYQVPTIAIKDADFGRADNWKAGGYVYQTGECIIDRTKIAYQAYCIPDAGTYQVWLPGGYLKMNILELDSQNKVIAGSDLHSGQKWKKNAGTAKIALTVYTNDKRQGSYSIEEYKSLIQNYPSFGLQPYQSYQVKGRMDALTAEAFMQKMNVGWSLGNSLDSKCDKNNRGADRNLKQELNWGNPYVTKDLIDYVAQCGFNTIRIPVTWYYNTGVDEKGRLYIGQEWLARVQEVVDYALANQMYVILNSHHDQPILYAGVSETEMQQVLANSQSLWQQIATYFKDYDEHLIFEGFNEIDNVEKSWNYSALAADQMNRMNQIFVTTVRQTGGNNASRILMVPTLLDGTSADILQAFVLPQDTISNRLIVQVHFYTKKYNQDIESDFAQLEAFSDRIGAPVVIGEFGTTSSYPAAGIRARQASNYVARAAEHGMKCIWWDNNSDYGVINRRNFAESDTAMLQALMDGARGVAYQSVNAVVLNQQAQYENKMPNLSSGVLENAYWGTITATIPWQQASVSQCMLSLTATGEASDIWLQRILFYNASGQYLSGKELQKKDIIVEVPQGTAQIKISLNSPGRNISWGDYGTYLTTGQLAISVSGTDASQLQAVSVLVK